MQRPVPDRRSESSDRSRHCRQSRRARTGASALRAASGSITAGRISITRLDQVNGVFGEIAIGGDDDGDRFAGVAHPTDRDRPAFDRRLDADHETCGQRLDVGAIEHRDHAGRAPGRRGVDRDDVRMRMRRAQHGSVQRAGSNPEIVDEAAASGQQGRVFDARNRTPDPRRRWLRSGECAAGGVGHSDHAPVAVIGGLLFRKRDSSKTRHATIRAKSALHLAAEIDVAMRLGMNVVCKDIRSIPSGQSTCRRGGPCNSGPLAPAADDADVDREQIERRVPRCDPPCRRAYPAWRRRPVPEAR